MAYAANRYSCCDVLPPEEYFEFGLYIPEPLFRRASDETSTEEEPNISHTPTISSSTESVEVIETDPDVIRKVFNALPGGKDGKISVEDAIFAIQQQGVAPSLQDMEEIRSSYPGGLSLVEFKQCLDSLKNKYLAEDTAEVLIQLFRHFDVENTGVMTKNQIYNILGNFGESVSREEVDAILKECGFAGDRVEYELFVNKLLDS